MKEKKPPKRKVSMAAVDESVMDRTRIVCAVKKISLVEYVSKAIDTENKKQKV